MAKTRTVMTVAAALLMLATVAQASGGPEYEVTITNLTPGQVFTPVLVAAHQSDVQPFVAGQPALVELEVLAESGNPGPLAALLGTLPQVGDVGVSDGVVPPGQSTTVRVQAEAGADRISLLAMLVPTNDAFVALNTVPAPSGNKSAMFYAIAYDAGTEANDESCDAIPGPPSVCEGEGFNEERDDRAPFVHVHPGIQGVGDLEAAERDWRNPVALVVVTRVPGNGNGNDDDDDDDGGRRGWRRR